MGDPELCRANQASHPGGRYDRPWEGRYQGNCKREGSLGLCGETLYHRQDQGDSKGLRFRFRVIAQGRWATDGL